MFSKLDVFNKVATALLKQRKRCIAGTYSCQYANGHGEHCAIGWLAPEEFDKDNYEGILLCDLSDRQYSDIAKIGASFDCTDAEIGYYGRLVRLLKEKTGAEEPEDFAFLRELQYIHDNTEPYTWPSELKKLGQKHFGGFIDVNLEAHINNYIKEKNEAFLNGS